MFNHLIKMRFSINQTGSKLLMASSLCLLLSFISAASTERNSGGSRLAPLLTTNKVFNYQDYMPIKEDRLDGKESTQTTQNETETTTTTTTKPSAEEEEAEAACWKMIHDQSLITFASQRKVLDELEREIKDLKINDDVREFINKTSSRMRENMAAAESALEMDSPDSYFDALFDTSEDIITMSSILREPNLDDDVFLVFVKAISRLGRNNASMIQEFTEMCSLVQKSPKPKKKISSLSQP